MLCDVCQKEEATVFFKAVINNKSIKFNLCEACAKEKGLQIKPPFPFSDIFKTLADFGLSLPTPKVTKKVVCSTCGLSYDEFREDGKLGCEDCYDVFSSQLDTLLEKMYGTSRYGGKVLAEKKTVETIDSEISKLQKELEIAIKNEDYEKAAELRDKIKELKKQRNLK